MTAPAILVYGIDRIAHRPSLGLSLGHRAQSWFLRYSVGLLFSEVYVGTLVRDLHS